MLMKFCMSQERIESGEDLGDALPLDIASLMKQFFRELPEPLLTSRLHDIFIKCYSLENESKRNVSLLLLCLMLPWQHLCTLRFIMLFLATVASHCENNKMDVQNLAVCLAPNFIHNHGNKGDKMTGNESRMLEVGRSQNADAVNYWIIVCHSNSVDEDIKSRRKIVFERLVGAKPLSEPMVVRLPTHRCVTRPQWVKGNEALSKEVFLNFVSKYWNFLFFHNYCVKILKFWEMLLKILKL